MHKCLAMGMYSLVRVSIIEANEFFFSNNNYFTFISNVIVKDLKALNR